MEEKMGTYNNDLMQLKDIPSAEAADFVFALDFVAFADVLFAGALLDATATPALAAAAATTPVHANTSPNGASQTSRQVYEVRQWWRQEARRSQCETYDMTQSWLAGTKHHKARVCPVPAYELKHFWTKISAVLLFQYKLAQICHSLGKRRKDGTRTLYNSS